MPSSVARRAARQAARLAAEARRPAGRGREGWWSSHPAPPPRLKRASSTNPKDTGPAESPALAAPPPPPPPPPAAPPPLPTLPTRPPRPRAPLPRSDGCGCGGCGGCGGGGGGGGGGVLHGILDSGAGGFSSGPAAGPAAGPATGTGTGSGTATVAATSDSRCAAAPSSAVSFAAVSRARGLRRCSGHRNASGSSSLTLTPSSATAGMEVAAAGGWSTLLGGEVGRCVEDAAGCSSTTLRAMSSSVAARSADADAGQRGGSERGARGPSPDMAAQSRERVLRVASTARPRVSAQRAWYAFCRVANRCFKSKVCIVARTDANRYRSLRALCKPPYRASCTASPSPCTVCSINSLM